MITTMSLVNICHYTWSQIFSCDENFKNLSQELSNMQYSIINYNHHAAYYALKTIL